MPLIPYRPLPRTPEPIDAERLARVRERVRNEPWYRKHLNERRRQAAAKGKRKGRVEQG